MQVVESAPLTLRLAVQEVWATWRLNLAAVIFLQARAPALGRPERGPMNPLRAGLSVAVSRRLAEFLQLTDVWPLGDHVRSRKILMWNADSGGGRM